MSTLYIAGPITGHEEYHQRFQEARDALEDMGFRVINPAALDQVLPAGSTWHEYMSICLRLIRKADAVILLPGWENSRGACVEYGYAYATDKVVMELKEVLKV